MAPPPILAARSARVAYRIRNTLGRELEAAMLRFLARQARRVASRLPRKAAGSGEPFDVAAERAALADELRVWYTRTLELSYEGYTDLLGTSFELDDPLTRSYLRESGENIRQITETTRDAVRRALVEGQKLGEGHQSLAKRIQDAAAFKRPRAITVARTEMGFSTNRAAILNYRGSGVVKGVLVFDSTDDPICAEWAGKRIPLADIDEVPKLGHPRCIRAFGALTEI